MNMLSLSRFVEQTKRLCWSCGVIMMSIVFLSCVFIFLLFFSFLCQVGIYRFCLVNVDKDLDIAAKKLAFNSQLLLLVVGGLSFYGQWAMLAQFILLLVIPIRWLLKSKGAKVIRFSLLQLLFQYIFFISFLSVYHFTAFAVDKGVFRPLPNYISLPVIEPLNDKIKEVFIDF